MSLYSVAVFLHVVGALGLSAALGVEWVGVRNLRRAATVSRAREWIELMRHHRWIERLSLPILLVTGAYLTVTTGGGRPWIGVGLLGLFASAALSMLLSGRRLRSIGRALPGDGSLAQALARQLADPVLTLSACLRTALALGIVFIMSTKPDRAGALSALGIALMLGLAAGLPPFVGRARAHGA